MGRPGFPIFGEVLLAQWFQPKMASVASYKGTSHLRAFGPSGNPGESL
jgi:hypothetical protein